jgi:hypothetical protein
MSYQQSNNTNNFNNTSKFLDHPGQIHYRPQASNRMQVQSNTMLTSNLDIYIPRVAHGTTEEQIKAVFTHSRVGTVEYCDLSLTKDKDTKKPQYLSAFIKLISWSNLSGACEDFAKNGSIRLYLSRETSEFWMILPNKNPLPRSHVNTSQLAAATDKLFEQTEKITEKAEKFEDEMRAEMAEMRMFIKLQEQSIDALKIKLTTTHVKILELSMENDELKYQLKRSTNAIFGHDTIDAYEEAEKKKREDKKQEEDKKLQDKFDAELDEILDMPLPDNAFTELSLMPPKVTRCSSIANWTTIVDEDECIFSNKPRQSPPIVEPLKAQNVSPAKPQTLTEIVLEHPDRAIASRDFCGNF